MDEVGLGKALQMARKKAGLTQQELCHQAGLSYSTLAKIERGAIKSPSVFTIQAMATVMGLSLDELIGHVSRSAVAPAKKVTKSGVRFIFFDVNGCLVRFYHRAFTQLARESGKSGDAIETTFWHFNDAVCRGEIGIEEFNEHLSRQLEMPDFDWPHYYLEAIEPITEMQELLRWAAGLYNIGLLTNIMPGQLKAMVAKGVIPDLPYAAVIDSSEVGVIKPEPEIYDLATKAAGVRPEEILLVDDSRTNVMAAERAGWHVLWFDDYHPEEGAERVRDALEPAK